MHGLTRAGPAPAARGLEITISLPPASHPSSTQIGDVSRLLAAWRGPGAVLLNAGWWADDAVPAEYAAFVGSFEAVYAFIPLEVKVRAWLLPCLTFFCGIESCCSWGAAGGPTPPERRGGCWERHWQLPPRSKLAGSLCALRVPVRIMRAREPLCFLLAACHA